MRYNYAKKYSNVLVSGNAQILLTLSKPKQIQIMKSLSLLSKFLGCYDKWKEIKEKYQLKWSEYNSTDIFQNLVNQENSFTLMLEWLKTAIDNMTISDNNILIYCTLTNLRLT
ncbi:MAG: hypothetical protein MRJ93_05120 [Nitrososphaeraceae archaeon]|nr:hypothetical protein [Nitrososphaeraceae archaeon]